MNDMLLALLCLTMSLGSTSLLYKCDNFSFVFLLILGGSCVTIFFSVFFFHLFCFDALSCSATWTWKNLSVLICIHQTFYNFSWCSEINFFILLSLQVLFNFLTGIGYFFLIDKTLFGQRQSWQRDTWHVTRKNEPHFSPTFPPPQ